MTTAAGGRAPQGQGKPPRNVAPIRWPKPNAFGVGMLILWLIGIGVAIAIPAVIVPPSATTAATGKVLTAFLITVGGAVVMIAAGLALFRRYRDAGLLVFTFVPSATVIGGGFIIMGLKLFS